MMYLVEFVGTTLLCLSATSHSGDTLFDADGPYGVAATIVMIVGYGAPVSGAHYNPNLTLGFWICGDRKSPNPILYVLCALLGALLGNLLTWGIDGFAGGIP